MREWECERVGVLECERVRERERERESESVSELLLSIDMKTKVVQHVENE